MSVTPPQQTSTRTPNTMPVLHLVGGLLITVGIAVSIFGFLLWQDENRTDTGRWLIVLALSLMALGALGGALARWMDSMALRRHLTK